jgi:hypothetical protein
VVAYVAHKGTHDLKVGRSLEDFSINMICKTAKAPIKPYNASRIP